MALPHQTPLGMLAAYAVVLVALGLYFARRVRKSDDFLVAGRALGPGLVFSTFLAANIGAGSTVGAAALGYSIGWSAWWWVGSAGIGSLILAATVGPRIWYWGRAEGFRTLGDWLEYRYSRAVRGWVTAILWIGTIGLLAAQLVAIAVLLEAAAGVPRWQGTVAAGTVVITYFVAGGLLGAARINFLELVVLVTGFLLAVPFALDASGEWRDVSAAAARGSGSYLDPVGIGPGGILYYVAFLVPSFIVSPGLVQKVYGARSASAARIGIACNGVALLAFAAVPPLLGIIAAARFPDLADPQLALPKVILELVPPWLGILGVAAIFSAEISTCDAVLSMLSSSLAVDVYGAFFRRGADAEELLRASRLAAAVSGLLGVALAIVLSSILDALQIFYSLIAVALLVPVVGGLYARRPDARAALAAILTSVPVSLALRAFVGKTFLGVLNPYLVGIGVSAAVFAGMTLARRRA